MSKREHQPTDIDHFFASGKLARLKIETQQRHSLTRQAQTILAQFNLSQCELTEMVNGKAVISAPSAAWLNRLRQLKSNLLSELRRSYPSLISLELKINPNLARVSKHIPPETQHKDATPNQAISAQTADHIRRSAQHLPDELREKLERIAALCGEKKK